MVLLHSLSPFTVCQSILKVCALLTGIALERLALLKQDASQIGINARQTVEFLDRVTEGKDGLPVSAISLQGPTEQYQKWSDVEEYIIEEENDTGAEADNNTHEPENIPADGVTGSSHATPGTTNMLSQMLLSKLNFAKEADLTPPASPNSSAKTSPEITAAKLVKDSVIVPHSLKPLVNAVVWQANNGGNPQAVKPELYFISNSADACTIMRSFGINTKNIHQLRQAIGLEDQELKNHSKYLQKHPSPPSTAVATAEPKAMFKYEEDSDEEQVVFKPRGRGSASSSPIIHASSLARPSSSHRHSPRPTQTHPNRVRPEIPTEEIDPDSFDRGSFGRANGQRLVLNDGNHRPSFQRGGFPPSGPSRGFHRGSSRSFDRGSMRGRGRLFVP